MCWKFKVKWCAKIQFCNWSLQSAKRREKVHQWVDVMVCAKSWTLGSSPRAGITVRGGLERVGGWESKPQKSTRRKRAKSINTNNLETLLFVLQHTSPSRGASDCLTVRVCVVGSVVVGEGQVK